MAALLGGGSRYDAEHGWPGAVARLFEALDAAACWAGGDESGWQTAKLAGADVVLRTIQRRWSSLVAAEGQASRLAPHAVIDALAHSFVDIETADAEAIERSIDLLSASLALHATRNAAPELQRPLDLVRLASPHSLARTVLKVCLEQATDDDALWGLGFSTWDDEDELLAEARSLVAALATARATYWSFTKQLNVDAESIRALVERGWHPPRSVTTIGGIARGTMLGQPERRLVMVSDRS